MRNLIASAREFMDMDNAVYFLGNSAWHWFLSVVIAVAAFFAARFIFSGIIRLMAKVASFSHNKVAGIATDALKKSNLWFFAAIAIFFGAEILDLGEYNIIPLKILVLASFTQVGIWLSIAFSEMLVDWSQRSENSSQRAAVAIIRGLGKFIIWVAILLLIMDNFGVRVVSLLTGLGIGGIAIALAVQKILGDLFASISIMIDKPFEIGDFISIGEVIGNVESIGVKTTKIRSLSGEQIIIANSDLMDSRISNFKRMNERRINFTINASNKTSKENIHAIAGIVKNIIDSQENARFDRGHLKGFSPGSIDYEFIYWITKPDYLTYMDVQQKINLAVIDAFAERGIAMAYPAQKILMEK